MDLKYYFPPFHSSVTIRMIYTLCEYLNFEFRHLNQQSRYPSEWMTCTGFYTPSKAHFTPPECRFISANYA